MVTKDKRLDSPWIVERTVSTHNSPTRFWETTILDPICGVVARSCSDSETGSKQIAHLIAAAPEMYAALKLAHYVMRLQLDTHTHMCSSQGVDITESKAWKAANERVQTIESALNKATGGAA